MWSQSRWESRSPKHWSDILLHFRHCFILHFCFLCDVWVPRGCLYEPISTRVIHWSDPFLCYASCDGFAYCTLRQDPLKATLFHGSSRYNDVTCKHAYPCIAHWSMFIHTQEASLLATVVQLSDIKQTVQSSPLTSSFLLHPSSAPQSCSWLLVQRFNMHWWTES